METIRSVSLFVVCRLSFFRSDYIAEIQVVCGRSESLPEGEGWELIETTFTGKHRFDCHTVGALVQHDMVWLDSLLPWYRLSQPYKLQCFWGGHTRKTLCMSSSPPCVIEELAFLWTCRGLFCASSGGGRRTDTSSSTGYSQSRWLSSSGVLCLRAFA